MLWRGGSYLFFVSVLVCAGVCCGVGGVCRLYLFFCRWCCGVLRGGYTSFSIWRWVLASFRSLYRYVYRYVFVPFSLSFASLSLFRLSYRLSYLLV